MFTEKVDRYAFAMLRGPSIVGPVLIPGASATTRGSVATDRVLIARLQHRLGFGPRPGEYAAALQAGVVKIRETALTPPTVDAGLSKVANPPVVSLGPYPPPLSPARRTYQLDQRDMQRSLQLWALDRMVGADHGLAERMTWFWHGHWATAISKVEAPLPMYNYYTTLNRYALANFGDMSRAMVNDAALLYWLDGGQNTASAPNENLAREFMELFTLGVGNYTEDDVKAAAKALTGYKVDRNSGTVIFRAKDHYFAPITILGTTQSFDADSFATFITGLPECPKFLAARLWYRFVSSNVPLPSWSKISDAIATKLNISDGVRALAFDAGFSHVANSQVKAPVEWFVSACRALSLMPSTVAKQLPVLDVLRGFSQVPFDPPSVGGWPADEAWLSTASAQLRITSAARLAKLGDLTPISSLALGDRVQGAADWLGVPSWSTRTHAALDQARKNPTTLTILAMTAPEYLVNA